MSEQQNKLETYGVKVTTETKQKINELVQESGMSGREFMENLLANYEATRLTQANPAAEKEFQQLEHHLLRIKDIFTEKIKSMEDYRQQFSLALEETQQKHNQAIINLNEQIAQFKEQLATERQSLDQVLTENKKLIERNNELEESNRSSIKTVALYESNIEELRSKVEELKATGERYQEAQEEITELKAALEDAKKNYSELTQAKDAEINKLKLDHERNILKIQAEHAQDLRDAQNELHQEYNNRITEFTQRLQDAQANHGQETRELHQRYNERIEILSGQLEKIREELNIVKEEKYSLQSELKLLQVTNKPKK